MIHLLHRLSVSSYDTQDVGAVTQGLRRSLYSARAFLEATPEQQRQQHAIIQKVKFFLVHRKFYEISWKLQ
jgi:hypothetical protein